MDKNILYYGGCWPTNIGNGFIDIGAQKALEIAFGTQIHFSSEFPVWFFQQEKLHKNTFSLTNLLQVDLIVVSGMVCCEEFVQTEGPALLKAVKRGVKILLHGCGQLNYTKKETENFGNFLQELNPIAFVSRDSKTYDNLQGYCEKTFDGIDCAFFLPDAFSPAKFLERDYIALNFDASTEPNLELGKNVIRTHHACLGDLSDAWFTGENKFISDIPNDYLNIYANCKEIHSDRVHACIAGLAFGKKVKLYSNTPRAYLFEKVGCENIQTQLVQLDMDYLDSLKKKQIDYLKTLVKIF